LRIRPGPLRRRIRLSGARKVVHWRVIYLLEWEVPMKWKGRVVGCREREREKVRCCWDFLSLNLYLYCNESSLTHADIDTLCCVFFLSVSISMRFDFSSIIFLSLQLSPSFIGLSLSLSLCFYFPFFHFFYLFITPPFYY
jgi:hypothetical protein